jgi:hypothetical protein
MDSGIAVLLSSADNASVVAGCLRALTMAMATILILTLTVVWSLALTLAVTLSLIHESEPDIDSVQRVLR